MFLLFLLSSLAWSADLDFKSTLATALENSPGLQSLKRDVEIRSLENKNARAARYPSLDFTSTQGLTEVTNRTSSYFSTMSLVATETLYDNGITSAKIDSTQIALELAEAKYADERDRLTLTVADEFFRYSLAQTLLDVQKTQLSLVNRNFESISAQYRSGIKTRKDFLKIHGEVRRTEIDLESSKTVLEKSKLELLRIMGLDPLKSDTQFSPYKVEPKEITQPPNAFSKTVEHPALRILELQRRSAQIDRELMRRLTWPEVTLSAGADVTASDYLGTGNSFPGTRTSGWNALLGVKMNLWDWGIRSRNLEVASHKQMQVELDIQSRRSVFWTEASRVFQDYLLSHRNFKLSQELLDLETKSYTLVDTDFRNGRVTFWDVTYGLRDLLDAKVKLYTNYFNVKMNFLKYLYHEGRLNEEIRRL